MAETREQRLAPSTRPWLWLVSAGYLTALLLVVLTPASWALNRLTVRLFVFWHFTLHNYGDRTPPEFFGGLLNVVLFIPVGALVELTLRRRYWLSIALTTAISCLVELIQLIPQLHRQSSITDVLTNSTGGLLGVLGVASFDLLISGRGQRQRG